LSTCYLVPSIETMALKYKDYYNILSVLRDASEKDIRKAYKKLALKWHPDKHKGDDQKKAEEKFTEINEAFEVLSNPAKRKRYDTLGADWKHGATFEPPPGFEGFQFSGDIGDLGGLGGFSDFFEMLFGGGGRRGGSPFGGGGFSSPFAGRAGGFGQGQPGTTGMKGRDVQTEMPLTVEELYHGGARRVSLTMQAPGQPPQPRDIEMEIPPGLKFGGKMRLSGQGEPGMGGPSGDLLIKISQAAGSRFRADGYDVECDVPVYPWHGALGGEIEVPTLDGPVQMTVPAGVKSGQKLRLKGKGLKKNKTDRGDQFVKIQLVIPTDLSDEEKKLYEQLREKWENK